MIGVWSWTEAGWKFEPTKAPEVQVVPKCEYCDGPNPWYVAETFPGVRPFRMCSECLRKDDDTYWSGEEEWETYEFIEEVDKSKIPLRHEDKASTSECNPAWVLKGRRLGVGKFFMKGDIWMKMVVPMEFYRG